MIKTVTVNGREYRIASPWTLADFRRHSMVSSNQECPADSAIALIYGALRDSDGKPYATVEQAAESVVIPDMQLLRECILDAWGLEAEDDSVPLAE